MHYFNSIFSGFQLMAYLDLTGDPAKFRAQVRRKAVQLLRIAMFDTEMYHHDPTQISIACILLA